MKSNELLGFINKTTQEMASEYTRIQKRAIEDPGTAGDQGEENWASLFRDWLPEQYHIVTKGRILSRDGIASPQIDVIILHPYYPKKLLDKKLYIAGGVCAAFECKITLRAEHINKFFNNSAIIRRHLPVRTGTPFKELYSPIIYGLLAHSHCWKKKKSNPVKNIKDSISKYDTKVIKHPREMPDILCVADLATWTSSKMLLIPNKESNRTPMTAYMDDLRTQVGDNKTTPIGTLITHILRNLAWEDPSLRELADYFFHSGISGVGQGEIRNWEASIFSKETLNRILSRGLTNKMWDEWCIGYM